jgi:hypothetical protein
LWQSGCKKPGSIAEYLHDFVIELNHLLTEDLTVSKMCTIGVMIEYFVCDAPARSLVINVQSLNGYHGCDRCIQEGLYVH